MSDRRLKVFYAVAEKLSFTRAAEFLQMTQPAVTFQIRQLEDDLGTRLFDRSHNRISLTNAGEQVYLYAQRIFALYDEMHLSVRRIAGEGVGVLTIGASESWANYLLPKILVNFSTKNPGLSINIKVEGNDAILDKVANNVLDIGLVEGDINARNLQCELCLEEPLVAVSAPTHAMRVYDRLPIDQLIEFPLVQQSGMLKTSSPLFRCLKQQEPMPTPTLAMEVNSVEAVKNAVAEGMGIGVLPTAAVQHEIDIQKLYAAPIEPSLSETFYLVRQRSQFRSHLMGELCEYIQAYFAEQTAADEALTINV